MHNVADVRSGLCGWDLRRHAGGHTVPGASTAEQVLRRAFVLPIFDVQHPTHTYQRLVRVCT